MNIKYNYFVYEEIISDKTARVFWYGPSELKTFRYKADAEQYAKQLASQHGHDKTYAVGQFITKYAKTPAQIEKVT